MRGKRRETGGGQEIGSDEEELEERGGKAGKKLQIIAALLRLR